MKKSLVFSMQLKAGGCFTYSNVNSIGLISHYEPPYYGICLPVLRFNVPFFCIRESAYYRGLF